MAGTQQPIFGQGNIVNAGAPGTTISRNVITTASLAHATSTVQGWIERIQSNRSMGHACSLYVNHGCYRTMEEILK